MTGVRGERTRATKALSREKVIELEKGLSFEEGTRVEVVVIAVTPKTRPRKGSPQAILQLAGTLTEEEAKSDSQSGTRVQTN